MYGRRHGPVLLKTLICWTLIGLSSAGHRPYERWERPRHPRHHDRWTQRIVYPSLNDQAVHYPRVNDGEQIVQFPSLNDDSDSSQVQVKKIQRLDFVVAVDWTVFLSSLMLSGGVFRNVISEGEGHVLT